MQHRLAILLVCAVIAAGWLTREAFASPQGEITSNSVELALINAIFNDDLGATVQLLQAGVDPNLILTSGASVGPAIFHAIMHKRDRIALLLLDQPTIEIDAKVNGEKTILMFALARKALPVVERILGSSTPERARERLLATDYDYCSAVYHAATWATTRTVEENLGTVKLVLATLEVVPKLRIAALNDTACRYSSGGATPLENALSSSDPAAADLARLLIAAGADPKVGQPLVSVARSRNISGLDMLVDAGLDINHTWFLHQAADDCDRGADAEVHAFLHHTLDHYAVDFKKQFQRRSVFRLALENGCPKDIILKLHSKGAKCFQHEHYLCWSELEDGSIVDYSDDLYPE